MRNINRIKVIGILSVLLAVSILAISVWSGRGNDSTPNSPEAAVDHADTKQENAAQDTAASVQAGPLSEEYVKVAENDRLILYLKEANLAIRLIEKQSGYVWNSVIEDKDSQDNEAWKNFMASGLSIDYFKKDIPEPSQTDLLSETNKTIAVTKTKDGFSAKIDFNDLKIGLELDVKLGDGELLVNIPNKSIRETPDFELASVYAYPFLGATKRGEIPGYMFVPDGSGALINLNDNKGKFKLPFEAEIYGANDGIDAVHRDLLRNQPYSVQFPVFGIVHGVREHGMFGVVENGQFNAKIVAYPNGVNTQYNWVTAQYSARESYLQPTSRAMGGIIVHEKDRNPEDIQTRYFFLNGKEADYIGMAKTYQNYLQKRGDLVRQTGLNSRIPIQLDILGAESKNGLFFKQMVEMTTVEQLKAIVADMKSNGIGNPTIVYKGWNKGGLSGTSPSDVKIEKKLGSAAAFKQLIAEFKQQGTPLYFYDDFTTAYGDASRFSARTEAAKKVDKTVLEIPTFKDVYESYYYMSADKSASIVDQNISKYAKQGIGNLAVGNTGSILFSEWDDSRIKFRVNTANSYMDMMRRLSEQTDSVVLYSPNDYMLKYADKVLDVPMHSSQYIYTSETVPFVQMLLKGYKDYFAPYTNFLANSKDELLRMIEYGAYPSYYLTYESSYKLKFTNSDDVYTSAYQDWKEEMAASYQTLDEVLSSVRNATIEDRIVPAKGIVKIMYSNGKEIIVNYTGSDYSDDEGSVPAKGFKVIEVKR
ncbi:DUF5696 domain-containing protein [Paenibacillus solisilvae]|uniref:DUF5696 domain-containing protein n=1 Tax=Paenibacillus solisilvae TaxID=2486751 RepID=A0ABW0VYI7_9BACL